MAPHSSTLAWKIPWTEEPGGLQSMGSLRVGQDWATSLSFFTLRHWRRKRQPTPVLLPGESQGRQSLGGLLSMGSHRVGHDWSDLAAAAAAIIVRQEADGPQARHLQLVSCLHFLGWKKDGLQAGHLNLASSLHFLRQAIDGLPVALWNGSNITNRVNSQALSPVSP